MTTHILPLFVRNNEVPIRCASDVSAIRDRVFSRPLNMADPDCDLFVFIGKNDGETRAFVRALELATLGDDNTMSREELNDGRHLVIVHFGDSSDSHVLAATTECDVTLLAEAPVEEPVG